MGKRGPHGKPTELRILHGDREDRINRHEPKPDMGDVVPPYPLRPEAQEVWDRLGPGLVAKRVLTPWDVDSFAIFCDAVATYRECRERIAAEGYTARGSAGGVIKSPYWQIARDAQAMISQIGSRFGLTPSDRANLTMEGGDENSGSGAERLLS